MCISSYARSSVWRCGFFCWRVFCQKHFALLLVVNFGHSGLQIFVSYFRRQECSVAFLSRNRICIEIFFHAETLQFLGRKIVPADHVPNVILKGGIFVKDKADEDLLASRMLICDAITIFWLQWPNKRAVSKKAQEILNTKPLPAHWDAPLTEWAAAQLNSSRENASTIGSVARLQRCWHHHCRKSCFVWKYFKQGRIQGGDWGDRPSSNIWKLLYSPWFCTVRKTAFAI